MTGLRILVGYEDVLAYIEERPGLHEGGALPITALLLRNNTSAGRCAVGLHIQIEGRDHFVKLSLDMLELLAGTMRSAAVVQYGEGRKP